MSYPLTETHATVSAATSGRNTPNVHGVYMAISPIVQISIKNSINTIYIVQVAELELTYLLRRPIMSRVFYLEVG
jgi:hypothetical protein